MTSSSPARRGGRAGVCARIAMLLAIALPAATMAQTTAVPDSSVIGGLLPVGSAVLGRWNWTGAWLFPVGDPYSYDLPAPDGSAGFRLVRGVTRSRRGRTLHQGADLSNRGGGDVVRAAAQGLVIRAGPGRNGYGNQVVLAHREEDGSLLYSVYAHLASRSILVRAGDVVAAGQPLGRVGRSGRATSEHLHFEIRRSAAPDLQWEQATVLDPLEFVREHLPESNADSTWSAAHLQWARLSGVVPPGVAADAPLERGVWWRMLAVAARLPMWQMPADPGKLHDRLVEAGVLPADAPRKPGTRLGWKEWRRSLDSLRSAGLALAAANPIENAPDSERDLAQSAPGASSAGTDSASPTRAKNPTVAEACLALALMTLPGGSPGR